ncbi:MAG: hypothetical protein JKY54_14325 [Flavobacteriales bacterium]|jgi:hypothetical protein|nr:hypothetical protein [Flavobacteriales bacterium]
MKYAYSNIFNELVDAIEVQYKECAFYQIVCPVCHQPVFKGERSNSNTHYFSHYQRKGDDACELRISQYDKKIVEQFNQESKGQKLSEYLKRFDKLLHLHPTLSDARHKDITIVNESPLMKALWFHFKNDFNEENLVVIYEVLDEHADTVEYSLDSKFATDYPKLKQLRTAKDMLVSLITKPEESNFRKLFFASVVFIIGNTDLYSSMSEVPAPQRYAYNFIGHNMDTDLQGLKSLFKSSKKITINHHPYTIEQLLLVEIINFMAWILLQLPYNEIAKNHQGKPWSGDAIVKKNDALLTYPISIDK